MFGMGMGELLLILVVALLFVGPDKLPNAARAIGKGIRDFRKHTQDLQSTLEQDEKLGEAVRELRSALRDDPLRPRPPAPRPPPPAPPGGGTDALTGPAGPPSPPAPGAPPALPGSPPASAATGPAPSDEGPPVVTPATGAIPKNRPPVRPIPDPRPASSAPLAGTAAGRPDDPDHG